MSDLFAPPSEAEIKQRFADRHKNCTHDWRENTHWFLRPETFAKCYVRKRQCTICRKEQVYKLEVDPWVYQSGDIKSLKWTKVDEFPKDFPTDPRYIGNTL